MFNINDTILYGTEGVCKIVEITEKKVGNKLSKYYVLKSVYENGLTIFVPEENAELMAKMKRVLSEKEIYEFIKSIPNEKTIWIDDENERKKTFQEIISNGNRSELIRLIRTIYEHKIAQQEQGKKLYQSDEKFFKDAEKLLYNEFALVLNIKPNEVLPFIMEQIELKKEEI